MNQEWLGAWWHPGDAERVGGQLVLDDHGVEPRLFGSLTTSTKSKPTTSAGERQVASRGEVLIMSDAAQPHEPTGPAGLPRDLTDEELEQAPALESVDDLLIEDLTDEEADAFFAALDS